MPIDVKTLQENLRIWSEVKTTDPTHTKAVSFGRKFTSIDAMYQVQRATEVFGPIGIGWGYDTRYEFIESPKPAVVCLLNLWHGDRNNRFGPIAGMNELMLDTKTGSKFDEDAPKKALTDALTKGLSHLGFSADVFMGLYDDNKYVARARELTERERTRRVDEFKANKEAAG